jgi:hypothetical protein
MKMRAGPEQPARAKQHLVLICGFDDFAWIHLIEKLGEPIFGD